MTDVEPLAAGPANAITDVAGVRVGHHQRRGQGWLTGTTVVLPPRGTVAAVDVRGGAPGTRETDLLDPANVVQEAHAICLSGGSAFGLAAADGVMAWLAEHHIGYSVGDAAHHVVPIVPAAGPVRPRARRSLRAPAGRDVRLPGYGCRRPRFEPPSSPSGPRHRRRRHGGPRRRAQGWDRHGQHGAAGRCHRRCHGRGQRRRPGSRPADRPPTWRNLRPRARVRPSPPTVASRRRRCRPPPRARDGKATQHDPRRRGHRRRLDQGRVPTARHGRPGRAGESGATGPRHLRR